VGLGSTLKFWINRLTASFHQGDERKEFMPKIGCAPLAIELNNDFKIDSQKENACPLLYVKYLVSGEEKIDGFDQSGHFVFGNIRTDETCMYDNEIFLHFRLLLAVQRQDDLVSKLVKAIKTVNLTTALNYRKLLERQDLILIGM
jgi:hypothetical protein